MAENKAKNGTSQESYRKLNWWNTIPFGTHIRETIKDIQLIRSSLKVEHKKADSDEKDRARK